MRTLSLVVPMYNEGEAVAPLLAAIDALRPGMPAYAFEVVCVNDGSADDTLARLMEAAAGRNDLVIVDLSRNFGKEAALSAGLATASGDAVIPIDADLQDPPGLIREMVARWEEGFEVVVAHRRDRSADSLVKRTTASLFYRLHNRMSDVKIPPHVGDYRLMDRAVVDVLNALPENRRFMKGLFAWAGFRTASVEYDRAPRASGRTSFNGWRLWNLAVEGITSFSLLPLKIWTYVGAVVSLVSLLYGSWIVIRTLIYGKDVPGYASLIVAILFLGGLQLVGIGIIGEYLGRNYLESKRRPAYVIRKILRKAQ
jgi:polyisoprenyl-phosphate glycosyltransferase